jgi:hypothetical protein
MRSQVTHAVHNCLYVSRSHPVRGCDTRHGAEPFARFGAVWIDSRVSGLVQRSRRVDGEPRAA